MDYATRRRYYGYGRNLSIPFYGFVNHRWRGLRRRGGYLSIPFYGFCIIACMVRVESPVISPWITPLPRIPFMGDPPTALMYIRRPGVISLTSITRGPPVRIALAEQGTIFKLYAEDPLGRLSEPGRSLRVEALQALGSNTT